MNSTEPEKKRIQFIAIIQESSATHTYYKKTLFVPKAMTVGEFIKDSGLESKLPPIGQYCPGQRYDDYDFDSYYLDLKPEQALPEYTGMYLRAPYSNPQNDRQLQENDKQLQRYEKILDQALKKYEAKPAAHTI